MCLKRSISDKNKKKKKQKTSVLNVFVLIPLLQKLINYWVRNTLRWLLPNTEIINLTNLIVMKSGSARFHCWVKSLLHSQLLVQFGQHREPQELSLLQKTPEQLKGGTGYIPEYLLDLKNQNHHHLNTEKYILKTKLSCREIHTNILGNRREKTMKLSETHEKV